ncbi:hypothetical protein ALC57_11583 [Trachymyrmex cornetzi]|uniref:Uncharacterized protein n=1 Tax=Trachymyrmex cornetzi TaxID=471704 RepID=A0A151J2R3_9HYME|nr:hypothetical protein ALC57_11583 [Trachymyrmex cornetzi]
MRNQAEQRINQSQQRQKTAFVSDRVVRNRVCVRSVLCPIGKSCRVRLLICAIGPHSVSYTMG